MPQADTDVLKVMWQLPHMSMNDPRLSTVLSILVLWMNPRWTPVGKSPPNCVIVHENKNKRESRPKPVWDTIWQTPTTSIGPGHTRITTSQHEDKMLCYCSNFSSAQGDANRSAWSQARRLEEGGTSGKPGGGWNCFRFQMVLAALF